MIQRGWRAASVTRSLNSSISDSTQPGFQNSASSETTGIPVMSDSRRAKVDLPDPGDPMTRIRSMTQTRKSTQARRARRLQLGEIIAGMVRGAGQRARRHHQEPLGVGDLLVARELVRGDVTHHSVMLAGRLQILPDGQEINI